jgi:hypothetical protein
VFDPPPHQSERLGDNVLVDRRGTPSCRDCHIWNLYRSLPLLLGEILSKSNLVIAIS